MILASPSLVCHELCSRLPLDVDGLVVGSGLVLPWFSWAMDLGGAQRSWSGAGCTTMYPVWLCGCGLWVGLGATLPPLLVTASRWA